MLKLVGSLLMLVALAPAAAFAAAAAGAPTKYVEVSGTRIAYRDIGRGPPLIALTRLRGTLDTWDPLFLDELAKSNRVITVDFPGVGYSAGKLPATIGATADFVGAFADAMKLDRFVLLGWSWGGTVAQAFLVDHPGRATHVVLIATVPPGRNPVAIQQAFLDRAFEPVNDLDDEIVLFFEPKSAASRAAAKASRERIRVRPDVDARIPSTPEAIRAYLAASADYREDTIGRREKLMATRTPILVISGDDDISTAVENWFALKGRIPNAHLIVYPETGHGPQHQYPVLAAAQIALFQKAAIQE
ncbi:MAG TPA: alpha/beta hydrolase [Steroidobacteraceae bacterium]|nr:alpha/beta hydrolase [Steroidobacteraceae bacterium]